MIPHQWLIGGVALSIGSVLLAASISNHAWFFRLQKLRLLDELAGRARARLICAFAGCGLIVLGSCIVTGVLPRQASDVPDQGAAVVAD